MAETVILLAPGEEQIIRVRCAAPEVPELPAAAAPTGVPVEDDEGVAPSPTGDDEGPTGLPKNNLMYQGAENLGAQRRNNMAGRKTRKNRKNSGATRKERKQSGGKRGMNPFMKFASKERKNIMSSNPGMAVTEVGKELGARWRALSDAEKKKYSS